MLFFREECEMLIDSYQGRESKWHIAGMKAMTSVLFDQFVDREDKLKAGIDYMNGLLASVPDLHRAAEFETAGRDTAWKRLNRLVGRIEGALFIMCEVFDLDAPALNAKGLKYNILYRASNYIVNGEYYYYDPYDPCGCMYDYNDPFYGYDCVW